MSRLILHIGSPKAGSSAIQASLYQSSQHLLSQGVLVLPPNPYGRDLPSGFLAACHLAPEQLPRFLAARQRRNPERFARDLRSYERLITDLLQMGRPAHPRRWRARLERFTASLKREQKRVAVLSSEYLFRLPEADIAGLRSRFERLGVSQFRVVAYLRHPVAAYASFLQQWLRLSDDLERYNPFEWRYGIRENLEAWSRVFGDANIVVRPLVADQLVNASVVADFYQQCSEWLGLPIDGNEPERVNESLSTEALYLIQQLLSTVPEHTRLEQAWMVAMGKFVRLLRRESAARGGTPVRLQPWVARQVWESHLTDHDWLRERHQFSFTAPSAELLSAPLPRQRRDFVLDQLVVPPQNSEQIQQLAWTQLQAIVREGL